MNSEALNQAYQEVNGIALIYFLASLLLEKIGSLELEFQ